MTVAFLHIVQIFLLTYLLILFCGMCADIISGPPEVFPSEV